MDEMLRIGEVADLLNVTTKTIRHYEKLGLIEPRRTESDYRLYTPEDVLNIQRIRQLQGLGLSLKQIKMILGNADNGELWERVLASLLEQIESEIDLLEQRRERVATLLEEGLPDAFEHHDDLLGIPLPVQMYLDQHLSASSRAAWKREKQIYAHLSTLPGGDPQRAAMRALILGVVTGADLYERSILVAALFAADQQGIAAAPVVPLRWVHPIHDPAAPEPSGAPSRGGIHWSPPNFPSSADLHRK